MLYLFLRTLFVENELQISEIYLTWQNFFCSLSDFFFYKRFFSQSFSFINICLSFIFVDCSSMIFFATFFVILLIFTPHFVDNLSFFYPKTTNLILKIAFFLSKNLKYSWGLFLDVLQQIYIHTMSMLLSIFGYRIFCIWEIYFLKQYDIQLVLHCFNCHVISSLVAFGR